MHWHIITDDPEVTEDDNKLELEDVDCPDLFTFLGAGFGVLLYLGCGPATGTGVTDRDCGRSVNVFVFPIDGIGVLLVLGFLLVTDSGSTYCGKYRFK